MNPEIQELMLSLSLFGQREYPQNDMAESGVAMEGVEPQGATRV